MRIEFLVRRIRPLSFIPLLLIVLVAGSLVRADQSRSEAELRELKQKIENLQRDMESSQKDELVVTRQLDELEREITGLNQDRRRQLSELQKIEQRKSSLDNELVRLNQDNESSLGILSQLVRSSYMLGRQGGIKLLLNQQSPVEISRSLSYYRYLVEAKKRYIQEISQRKKQIATTNLELAQQQDQIDLALSRLQENHSRLEAKEISRRQQLNLIQEKLSDDVVKIGIYEKRQQEVAKLLNELKRNLVSGEVGVSQDTEQTVRQATPVLGGFRDNRGRMDMPLEAKLQHRFGERREESGLQWEGLMLGADEGQDVRAIYPGQVVYADWFRGYGQLMVLDHGDGFMSLYGHNQLLHVQLGETVNAGQLIASAGSTGGLPQPGLYFEIRENGSPVNPLLWCRI